MGGCCSSKDEEAEEVNAVLVPAVDGPRVPKICVKLIQAQREFYLVDFEPTDTILKVKEKVQVLSNIPVQAQKLIYAGQGLDDARVITDYGIKESSVLDLMKLASKMNATANNV